MELSMSESPTPVPDVPQERPYSIRRVRKRRRNPKPDRTPGDPRLLRIVIGTFFTGLVLSVLIACSGGGGGVGTPFLDVSGTGGIVSLTNHSGGRASIAVMSPTSFRSAGARIDDNEAAEVEVGSATTPTFVILFGFSRGRWPLHFWMGLFGGETG
jgi:hypothetical protein